MENVEYTDVKFIKMLKIKELRDLLVTVALLVTHLMSPTQT